MTQVHGGREGRPRGAGKLMGYLGLAFWQAWWMVAMCTDALLPDPAKTPFPVSLTVLLLGASCLGYAAVVAAQRAGVGRRLGLRGTLAVTGALSVLGSLGMGAAAHSEALFAGGGALFVAAVTTFSLGNALLLVTWGALWSTLATGFVGRLLCVSYTAAFALFFIVRALPLGAAIVVAALLPLASILGFSFARRAPQRTAVRAPGVTWEALPVAKMLAALFAANVVWGVSQKFIATGQGASIDLSFAFGAACLLAFTAGLFLAAPTDEPAVLYRPILPALACGIALILLLGPEDLFLGEGLMIFGGYCLDMFVMLVASDMAFRMRRPVVLVFGSALFVARTGSLLGTIGGELLGGWGVSTTQAGLGCIIVLVASGTLLFSTADLARVYRPHIEPQSGALFDGQCSILAQDYGLTAREAEVLALLARGRSAPFIAQELSIALGTAKNHVSSIYRKVGVCDRQSLHTVIERGGALGTKGAEGPDGVGGAGGSA